MYSFLLLLFVMITIATGSGDRKAKRQPKILVVPFWPVVSIDTGYVGVWYINGKIQDTLLYPGMTWLFPFFRSYNIIEVKPQSDELNNVNAINIEGIPISFQKIVVGNQLKESHVISTISQYTADYDQDVVMELVNHQVNVICSKHTAQELYIDKFDQLDDLLLEFLQEENDKRNTGLRITFVRLSKPKLPKELEESYLALAKEKTNKRVLDEARERIRAEKQNEFLSAEKEQNMKLMISSKQQEQKLSEARAVNNIAIENKEAEKSLSLIDNAIQLEVSKTKHEEEKLAIAAKKELYAIPGYVQLESHIALAKNSKYMVVKDIPNMTSIIPIGLSGMAGISPFASDEVTSPVKTSAASTSSTSSGSSGNVCTDKY